jgi:hypothetical protein
MALNDTLDLDRLDATVRRAFLGRPEKILLKRAVRLYKWTNRSLAGQHGISPWWSFVDSTRLPSGTLAEGFRVAEERAQRLGRSHREFARTRAAISEQFDNAMTNLLMVRLNTDAWGLAGQASGQPEFAQKRADLQHVFLIGGAYQVWIPNLSARDVQEIPALA